MAAGWSRPASIAVLACIGVVFVALLLPTAVVVGPDIGSLMIGTPDEFEIARGIHGMIAKKTLDYRIPAYGGTYPMVSVLLLKPILVSVGFTEVSLAIGLRTLSVVFGLLTVLSTFWLVHLITRHRLGALAAAAMVALTPEVVTWSIRIHPDTFLWFQLNLALGAIVVALRRRSQRFLFAALVLSVTATMTKLVGAYLLPWLILAQAHLDLDEPGGSRIFRKHVLAGAAWAVAIMYVTTPMLLVDSGGFVWNVRATSKVMSGGAQTDRNPALGWIEVLFDPRMAGPVLGAIALVFVLSFLPRAIALAKVPRNALAALGSKELETWPVAAFTLGYVFHLALSVRDYHLRYIAPVLPFLAVALGATVAGRWSQLPDRWTAWIEARPRWVRSVPAVLVAAAITLEVPLRLTYCRSEMAAVEALPLDPRLEVGRWLAREANPSDSILYDYNIYVPLAFTNAVVTYGLMERQVTKARPRYVLIHDERRGLFLDETAATGSERERQDHRERVRTLARLEQGELFDLRKRARFDSIGVTVYRAESPPSEPPAR